MKNVQLSNGPALPENEWKLLACWSPFRYAVNWHPDQVRAWYGLIGAGSSAFETGWHEMVQGLRQQGWIRLAQPGFSRHIWQMHPVLASRLNGRAKVTPEFRSAFYTYYNSIAEDLHGLLLAQGKESRDAGLTLVGWERFNLQVGLFQALQTGEPFGRLFTVLFLRLSLLDQLDQALILCRRVMAYMTDGSLLKAGTTEQKIEWLGVLDAVGRTLRERKNLAEAARFFREIDSVYQQDGQLRQLFPTGWAEVKRQLGALSVESGAFETGKAQLGEALALFQKNGDMRGAALVEEYLSQYFFEKNELELALVSIEKTRQLAETDGDDIRLVNALQIKAGILYALGRSADSRELYEWCAQMGQQLEQPFTVAKAHQGLGLLESTAGRFQESLGYYQKSLETLLRMPTDFSFDIAQIYYNMGNDCYHLERYPESETYYRRALSAYEHLDMPGKVAEIAQNLANVWYYLGDIAKSVQFDQKAAGIFAASGRMKELKEILENTVRLSREMEDPAVLKELLLVMQQHLPAQVCIDLMTAVEQKIAQTG